jgi:hypothetical protein
MRRTRRQGGVVVLAELLRVGMRSGVSGESLHIGVIFLWKYIIGDLQWVLDLLLGELHGELATNVTVVEGRVAVSFLARLVRVDSIGVLQSFLGVTCETSWNGELLKVRFGVQSGRVLVL